MRQAVRVGRQILLSRMRSKGKTGLQSVAAVSSTNVWAVGAQRLVPSVSNASLHGDGSTWSLELLTFLPNQPRQRRDSCDGLGVGALASNCPDCRLANLDRWTGEMALPRELGALDGPVFSDVSFEGSAIIRAGGRHSHCCKPHQIWDGEMDFHPVCVDDCRTVVCRAQDRAGEGTGRQLCFPYTRVRITIASAPIRAFKT